MTGGGKDGIFFLLKMNHNISYKSSIPILKKWGAFQKFAKETGIPAKDKLWDKAITEGLVTVKEKGWCSAHADTVLFIAEKFPGIKLAEVEKKLEGEYKTKALLHQALRNGVQTKEFRERSKVADFSKTAFSGAVGAKYTRWEQNVNASKKEGMQRVMAVLDECAKSAENGKSVHMRMHLSFNPDETQCVAIRENYRQLEGELKEIPGDTPKEKLAIIMEQEPTEPKAIAKQHQLGAALATYRELEELEKKSITNGHVIGIRFQDGACFVSDDYIGDIEHGDLKAFGKELQERVEAFVGMVYYGHISMSIVEPAKMPA